MPLADGQSLSFYEILGPRGAAGLGQVYRARDTHLEREVAIKVLPEDLADDEERWCRPLPPAHSRKSPDMTRDSYWTVLVLALGACAAPRSHVGPVDRATVPLVVECHRPFVEVVLRGADPVPHVDWPPR